MTKKRCDICNEIVHKPKNGLCSNCLTTKIIVQRSAAAMMNLHGIPQASGICVDCGARPATCRDHRHYASPLKVDFVCMPCNRRRGHALDLYDLIRQHRGLLQIEAEQQQKNEVLEHTEPVLHVMGGIPQDLPKYLADVETRIILNALTKTRHNRTGAAKLLGISFRSLRYRLERLKIE